MKIKKIFKIRRKWKNSRFIRLIKYLRKALRNIRPIWLTKFWAIDLNLIRITLEFILNPISFLALRKT